MSDWYANDVYVGSVRKDKWGTWRVKQIYVFGGEVRMLIHEIDGSATRSIGGGNDSKDVQRENYSVKQWLAESTRVIMR